MCSIASLAAVILEVSVRLAGAGRQVRRCIADSTGATEHDNLGGTKARQLREGRGRYAVPLGKEQRCAGKGRHGGAGEGIGVVRPGREIRGAGTLRVGTQRNRRGRLITVSARPPLHRGAGEGPDLCEDRGTNPNTVQLELQGCNLLACHVLVGGRPSRTGGCLIWCRWVCCRRFSPRRWWRR